MFEFKKNQTMPSKLHISLSLLSRHLASLSLKLRLSHSILVILQLFHLAWGLLTFEFLLFLVFFSSWAYRLHLGRRCIYQLHCDLLLVKQACSNRFFRLSWLLLSWFQTFFFGLIFLVKVYLNRLKIVHILF